MYVRLLKSLLQKMHIIRVRGNVITLCFVSKLYCSRCCAVLWCHIDSSSRGEPENVTSGKLLLDIYIHIASHHITVQHMLCACCAHSPAHSSISYHVSLYSYMYCRVLCVLGSMHATHNLSEFGSALALTMHIIHAQIQTMHTRCRT